jgi:hypothetical protein
MSFIRIGSGTGPGSKFGTEALVDSLRGSQRSSISPLDYSDLNGNLLGYYTAVLRTGNLAATIAANAPHASMRWSSTSSVAVILAVRASVEMVTAAATAVAGFPDAEAIIARAFTVADTTGTATTPTKMRANMAASAVADLRVATTAALTAGTRTLDSVGFGFGCGELLHNVSATGVAVLITAGNNVPAFDVYKWDRLGGHPPVLTANEGVVLRQSSAGCAAGTYNYIWTLEWAELAQF